MIILQKGRGSFLLLVPYEVDSILDPLPLSARTAVIIGVERPPPLHSNNQRNEYFFRAFLFVRKYEAQSIYVVE
jgi:hypothetical protein